ncbi:MAG: trypsin-like peptidase domain-containing protein, partial [Archangium sp.]|nr:trypsin-like peptidase domain-containing protein [Archangium sp.]
MLSPVLTLLILAADPVIGSVAPGTENSRPYCAGTYADDFVALSKSAVELSSREANFTSCLRTLATYECLSYASDGSVRRTKKQATAHGTAFGFRRLGTETLLVTNAHIAEWPVVTDEEHTVSGVPSGCKRISEQLRIVDNEKDTFDGDDISLTKMVSDPVLDVAVVKAKGALPIMPWKVGHSAALRERNVVEVRGFPLGAFKATVQGRVTSAFDHDDFKDWDHDDFVVDAQLSGGNSGSPVLAVNCATGEYELVGIFHADYSRGSSLNVVVHIDQVLGLLTTLKRTVSTRADSAMLSSQGRKRLLEALGEVGHLYAPLGGTPVELRARADGAVLYQMYPRDFPSRGWPVMVIEDLDRSREGGFGQLGRVWIGNARGLKEVTAEALEDDERVTLSKALDVLRRLSLLVANHRRASVRAEASREAAEELLRL